MKEAKQYLYKPGDYIKQSMLSKTLPNIPKTITFFSSVKRYYSPILFKYYVCEHCDFEVIGCDFIEDRFSTHYTIYGPHQYRCPVCFVSILFEEKDVW